MFSTSDARLEMKKSTNNNKNNVNDWDMCVNNLSYLNGKSTNNNINIDDWKMCVNNLSYLNENGSSKVNNISGWLAVKHW